MGRTMKFVASSLMGVLVDSALMGVIWVTVMTSWVMAANGPKVLNSLMSGGCRRGTLASEVPETATDVAPMTRCAASIRTPDAQGLERRGDIGVSGSLTKAD